LAGMAPLASTSRTSRGDPYECNLFLFEKGAARSAASDPRAIFIGGRAGRLGQRRKRRPQGPMMDPIGGASHGHGLLRGSRTVDLNQSSTLRVCGYSLRVGESLMQFAERFKCQKCGAWYAAMWEQSPLREPAPGTFNCPDCGTVVHSWSGIDHYTDWRLLRRPLTAPIAPAGAITGSRSRSRRGRR